jgi:hypothetical protein
MLLDCEEHKLLMFLISVDPSNLESLAFNDTTSAVVLCGHFIGLHVRLLKTVWRLTHSHS